MRLQPHFELSPQHPRLAFFSVHHERLAGVGHAEKSGAAPQLNPPLATTEIHRNRAVGIKRDV
ncbi:hypothetical protein D3C78_1983060 [compost metagenome]